jgi:hypothetical protein
VTRAANAAGEEIGVASQRLTFGVEKRGVRSQLRKPSPATAGKLSTAFSIEISLGRYHTFCISLAPARLDRYARGFTGHVVHPIDAFAPALSPYRVGPSMSRIDSLTPASSPVRVPHLCRTASHWLHSQHAPFAPSTFSQATRLPLQLFSSCIVSRL